jgi:RND family efflux transporter MFP subunit
VEDLETQPDEAEIATARAKVQAAELALRQAQLEAQDLGDGQTSAKREAGLTLEQAQLKLESAQKTLAGTTLVAPFSGTVVQINAKVGETASGTAVVLADLDSPMVQFWVEEADMKSMAIDNPVNIVFEALPDLTYAGKIVRVDPVLVTVGNTSAVQAWASIDVSMYPVALLGDMNVEVEVVAGEARNVLLAPVQALRKLSEDQYAVFVVLDSGDLEMRLVEVGLMDFVNAEIRSGLQRGEVVSLGETTTSSSSESPTDTTPRQFDMMPFPGG